MRIAAARLRPYLLPLVRPWVAASATLVERRGMLVGIALGDGVTNRGNGATNWGDCVTGWGDCAPLPSSGESGQARAFAGLAAATGDLPGRTIDDALAGLAAIPCPEVRWALETALLDAKARRLGLPLFQLLGGDGDSGGGGPNAVPINGALGILDEGCAARAEAALARGFGVAKVKLGVFTTDVEIAGLRAVARRTGGRLRLRLDANRAWSEAEAIAVLDAVAGLPIDGMEEPLAAPTVGALARLQDRYDFAIAVDESLPALGADLLLRGPAVRRLVIKPARLGGMAATLRLAARARAAGTEVVLTSVVDSAIGVTAAAHLARALPRPAVHGLGTLEWLAADVAPPPLSAGGTLVLPQGAGLGLSPSAPA